MLTPAPRSDLAASIPFDRTRLDRLMDAENIDLVVVTSKHNVQYLLGGHRADFFDYMDAISITRYLPVLVYPKGAPDKAIYIGHRLETFQRDVNPMWTPDTQTSSNGSVDAMQKAVDAIKRAGLKPRRIGAEFVERGDRMRGARDARRLLRQAEIGQALVFFPEGTFGAEVGLQHFHVGAFAAAVRANLPLIPVAIRGTRHCLPAGSPWPRPGTISIEALALLPAAVSDRESDERDHALQLRDAARGALLAALGEPDLDKSARH